MEKIAWIFGGTFVYRSSLMLVLGIFCAICMFLALYLGTGRDPLPAILAVPLGLVLSLILARLVHWYCRGDSYPSFAAAMLRYDRGGFALAGAFAGCLLAAWLLKAVKLEKNLPAMLDCMSIAGCLGIAVGRLGSMFNASDRGQLLSGPFSRPVINAVTGAQEQRLATFLLQSAAAAVLFAGLLIFYSRKRKKRRDGDVCLIFLLCYGASQVVLDSTRYDSLFLRSNGFVSAVQILGALALVTAAVVFAVRAVKAGGWKWGWLLLYLGMAGLIGGAGYMEYHVQRHGDQAAFAYSVMSLCLGAFVLAALGLYSVSLRENTPRNFPGNSKEIPGSVDKIPERDV